MTRVKYFSWWKHLCISINGDVLLHVHSRRQQGGSGLRPPSLGPVWLGRAAGEVPLCGRQIYTKGGCLSLRTNVRVWLCVSVCDCVVGGWHCWLFMACGLICWSIIKHENRRWHTNTHTHTHTPTRAGPFMCVNTPTVWDPIPPKKQQKKQQKKNQMSDHITVDNVTLLLPTCTFWATRQPTPFWLSARCNPTKPHFSPASALSTLQPSYLICRKNPQLHPQVRPEIFAGQWLRPLLALNCASSPPLTDQSWNDSHALFKKISHNIMSRANTPPLWDILFN